MVKRRPSSDASSKPRLASDDAFDQIFAKLEQIGDAEVHLSDSERARLGQRLAEDAETPEELGDLVTQFFELSGEDAMHVLVATRQAQRDQGASQPVPIPSWEETRLSNLCAKLNEYAIEKHKLPFHRAAMDGKRMPYERLFKEAGVSIDERPTEARKASGCPEQSFPRYVFSGAPWRLRASFHVTTVSRREDVGCHFRHGPYKWTPGNPSFIRNWITYSPSVFVMILMNSWGGGLAADSNHFFYKWWFVAMMGLSPYHLMNSLFARMQ